MSVISSWLSVVRYELFRYQLVLTSPIVGDIGYYYILIHIGCLLIKDIITQRKRVNCLIMHVMYFERTYYGIPSCGFHHRKPR